MTRVFAIAVSCAVVATIAVVVLAILPPAAPGAVTPPATWSSR